MDEGMRRLGKEKTKEYGHWETRSKGHKGT